MKHPLGISLIIVFFIIGMGVGYALTPEYAEMQAERQSGMMELGSADRNLDLRYVDGMIAHHQSAIYMLKQAETKSSRPEIKQLASSVIAADEAGIEQLYRYKKEWYGNTKAVTQFQKIELGQADDKFDLRLLNALLTHHQEAIEVAREVQTKSTRTEVLNLADEVITTLSANAETLTEWRKAWYAI